MHSGTSKKNPKLVTKLIKIFRNCETALKQIELETPITGLKKVAEVEKKIKKNLKSYKFSFELVKSASNCLFLMLFLVLKHLSNTMLQYQGLQLLCNKMAFTPLWGGKEVMMWAQGPQKFQLSTQHNK